MQSFDDVTPEERDQQNEAIITFLSQVYKRPVEASTETKNQTIAHVRTRLLEDDPTVEEVTQHSTLHFVGQNSQEKRTASTSSSISVFQREKRSWHYRVSLLVAVALLMLLIGSTALAYKFAQRSNIGPAATPTLSSTSTRMRNKAHDLVMRFHKEVDAWGRTHLYHDAYDGHDYALDGAYAQTGLGAVLDEELAQAHTTADFEAVINEANNASFDLHMLEADYKDHIPYDAAHGTDLQVLRHYQIQKGQVLVISLVEQSLRIYQDGKLVRAFLVTSGRQERPTLPGVWAVLNRQSPAIIKSSESPESPYWFPDSTVQHAILYHVGGYSIYGTWWRSYFGPGTEFPHYDPNGNQVFAGNGSIHSMDLRPDDAAWVYSHTDLHTAIVIY